MSLHLHALVIHIRFVNCVCSLFYLWHWKYIVCCILACSSFHEENVTSQVGQRLPQRVHGLLRCRDSQCGFSELVNSWLVALLDSLFVLASVVTWQIPLLTATFGSCTFLFELGLGDHTRLWCNSCCAVFNLKFDSLMHWASRCWLNLSRWVHLISGDWIWKRLVTCFWCYYCAVTVFDFLVILSWHCLVKPPWHDLWIQFVRHYHGPPSGDQHWQSGGFALRGVWGRLGGELGVGEQDARAHATWHNWIKIWFIESWLILCLQSESQIRVLFMNKSTSTQGHHPRFARHHDEQVHAGEGAAWHRWQWAGRVMRAMYFHSVLISCSILLQSFAVTVIFEAILLMNRLIAEGLEAHLLSSTRLVSLQRMLWHIETTWNCMCA